MVQDTVEVEEMLVVEEGEEEEGGFVNTDECVREVMTSIATTPASANLDTRQLDIDEETTVTSFTTMTCGCRKEREPCSSGFSEKYGLPVHRAHSF